MSFILFLAIYEKHVMEPVIINGEKAKYYFDLMEKYLHYSQTNTEEDKRFLEVLRELINENEEDLEFEVKVSMLNSLTAGVKLKKIDIIVP